MRLSKNNQSKSSTLHKPNRKWAILLSTLMAGGTLFSTCQTRLRDASIQGTKDFIFTILNPITIAEIIFGDTTTTTPGI